MVRRPQAKYSLLGNEKLTLPNLPKDLENREIILRSKTPILIKDAGVLSNLNMKLKTVFGIRSI